MFRQLLDLTLGSEQVKMQWHVWRLFRVVKYIYHLKTINDKKENTEYLPKRQKEYF